MGVVYFTPRMAHASGPVTRVAFLQFTLLGGMHALHVSVAVKSAQRLPPTFVASFLPEIIHICQYSRPIQHVLNYGSSS